MRLYALEAAERSEFVVPADPSGWERFHMFNGTAQRQSWAPIPVRRVTEDEGRRYEPADFPWLGAHTLVMRRRPAEALAELLDEYGELLPLECADTELWAYNVCRVVNALDETRSKIVRFPSSGRIMTVERYAFRPDQLNGHVLFKVPQLPLGPIFVNDVFVNIVTSRQLVGLAFRPVWEGAGQLH